MSAQLLEVVDVAKTFDGAHRPVKAIERVGFTVAEDEFVSVVGPSGCGKTTLLRCIAGLAPPTTGCTLLRGVPVTEPPPELAVVFQDYARSLFPWLTVRGNILLPLRRRRDIPGKERTAAEAIEAVGLAGFADHYPWQLSGGMQQRVAIARALAYRPRVLLMDEPFASVDAQTRADLEDLVLEVRRRFRMTVLLVTHDIDEAVYMSDRVVVLSRPPSVVKEELTVGLPADRHQITTKELREFARLRTAVYVAIKGQEAPSPQATAATAGG
ncbi:ABC transporter ATP-binding protein [Acrocarpospora macrocephala]|uniref:ABC transporter n=1 Tax=Acrocarpospora macrocephala TaxID=150177 RepID=A0A5M3WLU2_9ACTN|nr:ABC transporter ATP-binding protein [Acrocarpospora macrocephala]GES09460.1 ABC transporter [Acrocarpospora macrocephala]